MTVDPSTDTEHKFKPARLQFDISMMIGRMPFCTAGEISGVLGCRRDDVRAGLRAMKAEGVADVGYGGGGGFPERMYLTRRGAEELAKQRGCTMDQLVREGFAVTNDWLRIILQRSANVPIFYALAVAASKAQGYPCRWYWRRRGWLDGTLAVGPGFFMRVGRIGASVRRDSVRSRLGSMVESWRSHFINTALILCCDRTTEAFVDGWLRAGGTGIYIWTADERRLVDMDVDEELLTGPRRDRMLRRSFRTLVRSVDAGYGSEAESGLQIEQRTRNTLLPAKGLADRRFSAEVKAARLGAGERAVLDLVADWPLISRQQVVRMSGYREASLRVYLAALRDGGFVSAVRIGQLNLLVLGDEGLRYLSWKDRTQLRDLRTEWGLSSDAGSGSLRASDISSGKVRTLAGQDLHTAGLYEVVSLIVEDCREREKIELVEMLPPHRSERWMRRGRKTYGVRPDASGVVKLSSGLTRPFMLEFERRAVVPEKMRERLEPYQRYYDTLRRADAWSVSVGTLVVYDDRANASKFVKHCRENPYLARSMGGLPMPVFASSIEEMRTVGAAGACWMHANRLVRGALTLADACRAM